MPQQTSTGEAAKAGGVGAEVMVSSSSTMHPAGAALEDVDGTGAPAIMGHSDETMNGRQGDTANLTNTATVLLGGIGVLLLAATALRRLRAARDVADEKIAKREWARRQLRKKRTGEAAKGRRLRGLQPIIEHSTEDAEEDEDEENDEDEKGGEEHETLSSGRSKPRRDVDTTDEDEEGEVETTDDDDDEAEDTPATRAEAGLAFSTRRKHRTRT